MLAIPCPAVEGTGGTAGGKGGGGGFDNIIVYTGSFNGVAFCIFVKENIESRLFPLSVRAAMHACGRRCAVVGTLTAVRGTLLLAHCVALRYPKTPTS